MNDMFVQRSKPDSRIGNAGGLDDGTGKRRTKRLVIIAATVGVVLLLGLGGAATYFYMKYQSLQHKVKSSEQLSEADIINRIGRLYEAPKEKPSIAQVNDRSKLSDQAFFNNAQKDDYVVVYPKAEIVILYRASTDKIINIGPVEIDKAAKTVQ